MYGCTCMLILLYVLELCYDYKCFGLDKYDDYMAIC